MRRILLALNVQDVKISSIDFASYLANLTKSYVTGVFLEKKHQNEFAETLISVSGAQYEPGEDSITQNINIFENRCIHNYAKFSIHHLQGIPANEIIRESLFADVLLTDGNVSFSGNDGWPSAFVEELLENAKCPVIITPFSY